MDRQDGACNEADPLVWFEDEAQSCEFVDRENENMYPGPVAGSRIDFAVRGNDIGEQEAQVDNWSRKLGEGAHRLWEQGMGARMWEREQNHGSDKENTREWLGL